MAGGATVHKIDAVLTLPTNATTTATLAGLSSIVDVLVASELDGLFDFAPGITAFIPTNDAFDAIGTVAAALSVEQLQSVLFLHLVTGSVVFTTHIPTGETALASTLGENITVVNNGSIFVNNAQVSVPDVILLNGVGHVVSK